MQRSEVSEADRSTAIVPAVEHVVPWRLQAVDALPAFRLRVTFVDGTVGEVDLKAFLRQEGVNGTLFEPIRDPSYFAQARVMLGAVRWPNGAGLAPDAMYDAIRERGCWVVE